MNKKEKITELITELGKLTMIRQLEITTGFTEEQLCKLTSVNQLCLFSKNMWALVNGYQPCL